MNTIIQASKDGYILISSSPHTDQILFYFYIYMEFGGVVPPGDINLGVVSTYSKLWNGTRSPT